MSALVRPRGFASPRRSARFSSAWRVKGREEEASLGEPAARRSKAGGSAYLVVLHLPVVYVQLQADGGSHIRGNRKHGAARGGGRENKRGVIINLQHLHLHDPQLETLTGSKAESWGGRETGAQLAGSGNVCWRIDEA